MMDTQPSIMPEPDAESIFGLYAGGQSVQDISAELGLSATAVQDAIRDARSRRPQTERRENRVTWELHRTLVAKLNQSPGPAIACGRRNEARMMGTPRDPFSRRWVERWAELLAGPLDIMMRAKVGPSSGTSRRTTAPAHKNLVGL